MATSARHARPLPSLRPLLSSFPSPPSHIPSTTPTSSPQGCRPPISYISGNDPVNPPLSGPPASPLPPVPEGPSRVSEEEQIAFLTMRRASYASSSSRSRLHSRKSSNSTSGDESTSASIVVAQPTILRRTSRVRSNTGSSDGNICERLGICTSLPSPPGSASSLVTQMPKHTSAPSDISIQSTVDSESISSDSSTAPDVHPDRASSPDVATLIQRVQVHTPRSSTPGAPPGRRSRSSHSSGRRSLPGIKRLRSTPMLGTTPRFYPSTHQEVSPISTQGALGMDDDDMDQDVDTWEPSSADPDPDVWEEIWEEPEVEDSEEDVIDIRTPLPHLMLRAGLLSPHSKLLPRLAPSPEPALPKGRKAPVRDERDTVKRRQRHKDGKLLRGGIGLTTGLGWSDSEDEDAPSALTHRLSRLAPTLSRKSSMASYASSSSSPVPFGPNPSYTASLPLPTKGTSGSGSSTAPRSVSAASSAVSRSGFTASTTSTLGRSISVSTLSQEHGELSPGLPEPDVPAYPYTFPPPSPSESGHGSLLTSPIISGPLTYRTYRSPFFEEVDPFTRKTRPDDRSPTPTNGTVSGGSTTSLSVPSTPGDTGAAQYLVHPYPLPRPRPLLKALPPLPTGASGIPKTASMSSLRSIASTQGQERLTTSASSVGLRERTTSNASVPSVRARPSHPNTRPSELRQRTSSTSSTGSVASMVRPLKSAIKPASSSKCNTTVVLPPQSSQLVSSVVLNTSARVSS